MSQRRWINGRSNLRTLFALQWRIIAMLFAFQLIPVQSQSIEPPPPSYKDNIRETIHGVEIVDPYRWLENQESRATRVWLDAQIRYMDSLIDDLECRKDIRKRLEKLNRIDRIGMPTERGGLYFISKRRAKDDLSILYVRKGLHGKDEVLIDPHKLSEDLTTTVSTMDISDDGKLMAYGIRRGGEDEVEVRIMDVETRKDLPDRLPKAFITGFSFKKDKSGFYYGIRDLNIGCRVYYHAMGT
ncbi:MAG TPA: S9 family peptidase, partial [Armatimonadota bacterium]|nr:S9 family peptidase [Armatimonadota bacterium]